MPKAMFAILSAVSVCGMATASPVHAQYRTKIDNDLSKCYAGAGPAVMVTVSGINAGSGTVRVQSYRGTASDWLKKGRWINRVEAPARAETMTFCLPVPSAGTYAIAVRHDTNGNGKTDLTKDGGADDDDDMFLDDTTRALREEVASLKAQIAGKAPSFGPDTPERQQQLTAQRQLSDFVSERDEAGQPRRPFFDHLRPRIVEMALSHRNSTGQHVTTDDLQRFYDQALEEARSAFGNPTPNPNASGNSAAQAAKPVADQIKERAAAAQKAQRASKSIDGTGQGASRRPALSESASLDEVIRHFASQEE